MNKKLVSIVLPTYNGSKFIRESIESIINQTYTNWELIIVNDCSTDNTLDIINEYAKKDFRIKIYSNEKNLKLPLSLNVGFSYASGDFHTWTSDDNKYRANAIEYMVDFLSNHNNYDCISCDFDLINEKGEFINHHSDLFKREFISLTKCAIVGACFMYTSNIAKKVGYYDDDFFCAEDFDYWCRLGLIGNIFFSNENLYEYRINSQSLSSTKKSTQFARVTDVRLKYAIKIMKKCKLKRQKKWELLLEFYRENLDKRWLNVIKQYNIFCYWYVLCNSEYVNLIEEWRFLFYLIINFNKKIAFWGASIYLEKFLKKYQIKNKNIIGIIDNDKNKHFKSFDKYTIYPAEYINKLKIDTIVFSIRNKNSKIYEVIKNFLRENYPNVKLSKNMFEHN